VTLSERQQESLFVRNLDLPEFTVRQNLLWDQTGQLNKKSTAGHNRAYSFHLSEPVRRLLSGVKADADHSSHSGILNSF
jgi:hypothetical protein